MSLWIFRAESVSALAAPERHPTIGGRAAVPHPLRTATLGVPDERRGAEAKLGERRELKVGFPGLVSS